MYNMSVPPPRPPALLPGAPPRIMRGVWGGCSPKSFCTCARFQVDIYSIRDHWCPSARVSWSWSHGSVANRNAHFGTPWRKKDASRVATKHKTVDLSEGPLGVWTVSMEGAWNDISPPLWGRGVGGSAGDRSGMLSRGVAATLTS